jgi:hypothetical protein
MHKIYLSNSNGISLLKLGDKCGFKGDHIHLDMILSIRFLN